MDGAIKKGLGFGLTSSIITTLGVLVGLSVSTNSVKAVVAGILIVAVSDALSDSMGIHVAEETEGKKTNKAVWKTALATLLSKIIFTSTFVVPVLIWPLNISVYVCIGWGLLLTVVFSFYIAKIQNVHAYKIAIEHISLTLFVIVLTYFVGQGVSMYLS